jgi:glyoxylase-like metal-dependent hydrolase (beta-lactamase superfamily II)
VSLEPDDGVLGETDLVRLVGVALGFCQRRVAEDGRFTVIDYRKYYPVAPGMVLIKAPGHAPDHQMVLIALQSGREILHGAMPRGISRTSARSGARRRRGLRKMCRP